MKKVSVFLTALLVLSSAGWASVSVKVVEPENFTDLEISGMRSDRAVEYFQREIQRHMERRMGYSMPPDYTLTLIFHDVDMAGAYEPWLRPPHDRVRVVRSTYPPRLQFDYTLLNEEGEVIASGSENIVDLVFQMQIARRVARDDNLFYEKEILDSWFRDTIRNLAIDPS